MLRNGRGGACEAERIATIFSSPFISNYRMMEESYSNSSAVFYLPEAETEDSDENEKDDKVNDEFELPMAAVITIRRRSYITAFFSQIATFSVFLSAFPLSIGDLSLSTQEGQKSNSLSITRTLLWGRRAFLSYVHGQRIRSEKIEKERVQRSSKKLQFVGKRG